MICRSRPGAALILVLLLLVVLDCIVLGTLHTALLEQRTAHNGQAALQLRLEAEGAARRALTRWSEPVEALTHGRPPLPLVRGTSARGYEYRADVERLRGAWYLVRAEAREPAPAHGRAAALLLVQPPPWPLARDPAPAALSAAGMVTVSGAVVAHPPDTCVPAGSAAVQARSLDDITLLSGGSITGAMALLDGRSDPTALLPRLLAFAADDSLAQLRVVAADLHLDGAGSGVLVVAGDVTLTATARFNGLLIAGGRLRLQPGAILNGAAHVGGDADIRGIIAYNQCLVMDAFERARIGQPRPARSRAALPAF